MAISETNINDYESLLEILHTALEKFDTQNQENLCQIGAEYAKITLRLRKSLLQCNIQHGQGKLLGKFVVPRIEDLF